MGCNVEYATAINTDFMIFKLFSWTDIITLYSLAFYFCATNKFRTNVASVGSALKGTFSASGSFSVWNDKELS